MTRLVTVEDQGACTLHVNGGVDGQESQKVKYLPAEYYTHFLSETTIAPKLDPSEFTVLSSPAGL